MIRRIDVLARSAYGVLCGAAMAGLAVPVLLAAAVIAAIIFAFDGDVSRGVVVWLVGWAAALSAAVIFFSASYFAWPLASDWVTEWQGYATGLTIGAAGLGLMALLVFVVPVPTYIALSAPVAATFAAGFSIPGRFLGLSTPGIRTHTRVGGRR